MAKRRQGEMWERQEKPRSPTQQWLDWASAEWEKVHNATFVPHWGRDCKLIAPILRQLGEPELKARWLVHIATEDEWNARSGWDVLSFARAINRYDRTGDRAKWMQRHLERKADQRDPLTGVAVRFLR